jgi:hypothetical protein
LVQLSPWSRILEKLIVVQLLKIFPEFYGILRFTTVFARTCHGSILCYILGLPMSLPVVLYREGRPQAGNSVLRRILGPQRDETSGGWRKEHYIPRHVLIE